MVATADPDREPEDLDADDDENVVPHFNEVTDSITEQWGDDDDD